MLTIAALEARPTDRPCLHCACAELHAEAVTEPLVERISAADLWHTLLAVKAATLKPAAADKILA